MRTQSSMLMPVGEGMSHDVNPPGIDSGVVPVTSPMTPRLWQQSIRNHFPSRSLINNISNDDSDPKMLQQIKDNNTLRMIGHNINSVSIKDQVKLISLFRHIHSLQCDVSLFTESCINSHRRDTWEHLRDTASCFSDYSRFCLSSVPDSCPGQYQPGGTISHITGGSLGRICLTGSDAYGRWTWFTLIGKNNMRISIINAYMVSQSSITTGSSTYYMQLYRAMQQAQLSSPLSSACTCS